MNLLPELITTCSEFPYAHSGPRAQSLQSVPSIRQLSNASDTATAMQRNRSFQSPDGSQQSSSQGSMAQQSFDQQFSASHFIFTPPGYEQQSWQSGNPLTEPSYSGLSDVPMLDPLLGDPSVNEMDVFGSISWGSLNGKHTTESSIGSFMSPHFCSWRLLMNTPQAITDTTGSRI